MTLPPEAKKAIEESRADIERMKVYCQTRTMTASARQSTEQMIAKCELWTGKHIAFRDNPNCIAVCTNVGLNTIAVRMCDDDLWWIANFEQSCIITDEPLRGTLRVGLFQPTES